MSIPRGPKDYVYEADNEHIPPTIICRCGEPVTLWYDKTFSDGSIIWWGECICRAPYYVKLSTDVRTAPPYVRAESVGNTIRHKR